MRTLDQILTKKDYSRKTPASLFYKDSPLWQKLLTIGCVVFLAGAGLGACQPSSAGGGRFSGNHGRRSPANGTSILKSHRLTVWLTLWLTAG